MLKFCPKCHTQAYDDTSFFCYKCGMQLPIDIPEKKKDRSQTHGIKVPDRESTHAPDDSLPSPKPASIPPIKPESTSSRDHSQVSPKPSAIHPANPVEICAQCGGPIIDKSRIFCKNCGAYIREELSGDMSSIVKHPVLDPLVKIPHGDQNPVVGTIQEQVSAVTQRISVPSHPEAYEWRSIFILAGIVIIFFILMLVLLLMFP